MQPIRTNYKGILFRSKLEAEWAKFFDSLSIPWLYEQKAINLLMGQCTFLTFGCRTQNNGLRSKDS